MSTKTVTWTTGLSWRVVAALASIGRYRDAKVLAEDTIRRRRLSGPGPMTAAEEHGVIVIAAQAMSAPMRFLTRDPDTGLVAESLIMTPLSVILDAVRVVDQSPLADTLECTHYPWAPALWQLGNIIRWAMQNQPSQVVRLNADQLALADDVLQRTADERYIRFVDQADALARYGMRVQISSLRPEPLPRRTKQSGAEETDPKLLAIQRVLLRPRAVASNEYELNIVSSHEQLRALLKRQ